MLTAGNEKFQGTIWTLSAAFHSLFYSEHSADDTIDVENNILEFVVKPVGSIATKLSAPSVSQPVSVRF